MKSMSLEAKSGGSEGFMNFAAFMGMNKADEVHREFWDGFVVEMVMPSAQHQSLVGEVGSTLHMFLKGKPCKPYPGRDVHLKTLHGDTLYIPDVLVLCDKSKDDGQTIEGAPDFVLEVWSPSNTIAERQMKITDYKVCGVREIWEMTGKDTEWTLIQHVRQMYGEYQTVIADLSKPVPVNIFEGCSVDFRSVIWDNA